MLYGGPAFDVVHGKTGYAKLPIMRRPYLQLTDGYYSSLRAAIRCIISRQPVIWRAYGEPLSIPACRHKLCVGIQQKNLDPVGGSWYWVGGASWEPGPWILGVKLRLRDIRRHPTSTRNPEHSVSAFAKRLLLLRCTAGLNDIPHVSCFRESRPIIVQPCTQARRIFTTALLHATFQR